MKIWKHSLTVGYNLSGQSFFDAIAPYKEYIAEFYFSFSHTMRNKPLDEKGTFLSLKEADQHGIRGNLLINSEQDEDRVDELIDLARKCVDLKAVTLLDKRAAKQLKAEYPDLAIHMSTKCSKRMKLTEEDAKYIDCVNLNEPFIHGRTQKQPIRDCKKYGVKTKFIANRGCICQADRMTSVMLGKKYKCCNSSCRKLNEEYPWIDLARVSYYKEMVPYWRPDILKLSTRDLPDDVIGYMLADWCQDSKTMFVGSIPISEAARPVLQQWAKTRCTECDGRCNVCGKCKAYYEKIVEANKKDDGAIP